MIGRFEKQNLESAHDQVPAFHVSQGSINSRQRMDLALRRSQLQKDMINDTLLYEKPHSLHIAPGEDWSGRKHDFYCLLPIYRWRYIVLSVLDWS